MWIVAWTEASLSGAGTIAFLALAGLGLAFGIIVGQQTQRAAGESDGYRRGYRAGWDAHAAGMPREPEDDDRSGW